MIGIGIILLFLVCVEIVLSPRIDTTRDGKKLLWYGKNERKFIEL
jgi:hypothetical protein